MHYTELLPSETLYLATSVSYLREGSLATQRSAYLPMGTGLDPTAVDLPLLLFSFGLGP